MLLSNIERVWASLKQIKWTFICYHNPMASDRPSHTICPPQKLSKDNIGELQVQAHKNFVQAANIDPTTSLSDPPSEPSSESVVLQSELACSNMRKHHAISDVDDSPTDNNIDDSQSQVTGPKLKKKSKKKKKTSSSMSPCCLLFNFIGLISNKVMLSMKMEFTLTFMSKALVIPTMMATKHHTPSTRLDQAPILKNSSSLFPSLRRSQVTKRSKWSVYHAHMFLIFLRLLKF